MRKLSAFKTRAAFVMTTWNLLKLIVDIESTISNIKLARQLDYFHIFNVSSSPSNTQPGFCSELHREPRPKMTRFRPCIDLHSGQVKQIVGGTLTTASSDLKTNFASNLPASHFAKLYREISLTRAHVIMLGPGNEQAAREALSEWPGGLQVGGGITDSNAKQWIEWGADKVSVVDFS